MDPDPSADGVSRKLTESMRNSSLSVQSVERIRGVIRDHLVRAALAVSR